MRRRSGASDGRVVRRVEPNGFATGGWPATVPAVATLLDTGLDLPSGVTLLVGENGTGKSTIVEAVAMAFGLSPEGGTPFGGRSTYGSESELHRWLQLERAPGAPRWGFFLRAETMHGYYTYLAELADEERRRPHSRPATDLHGLSHGESFLELLRTRFDSPGLSCLDEPEAALSFQAQIALASTLHELAAGGAQVLCATHSPLLAALPGANILEVGEWGLRKSSYEELALVQHWKAFLDEPMRYLRHVL